MQHSEFSYFMYKYRPYINDNDYQILYGMLLQCFVQYLIIIFYCFLYCDGDCNFVNILYGDRLKTAGDNVTAIYFVVRNLEYIQRHFLRIVQGFSKYSPTISTIYNLGLWTMTGYINEYRLIFMVDF